MAHVVYLDESSPLEHFPFGHDLGLSGRTRNTMRKTIPRSSPSPTTTSHIIFHNVLLSSSSASQHIFPRPQTRRTEDGQTGETPVFVENEMLSGLAGRKRKKENLDVFGIGTYEETFVTEEDMVRLDHGGERGF